ncbi:MAG: insulinase family protein [Acidobacteriota bacterium]
MAPTQPHAWIAGSGRPASGRLAAAWLVMMTLLIVLGTTGQAGSVRPPRLDYTMTTLDNGLRVVLLEDHSTPIVNIQVWYHVGSKDERAGRTGFAHLFEHMMFKGSKNVEPEQHTSRVSEVGGLSNAYTTEDVTVFWDTVPSQHLPMVIWLEADRMATLRIDKDVFTREREVVKEERRMRFENQPYGRLSEIVFGQAFTVHPYKHTVIGSMDDLEAASVDDVREFFRTYYVPANTTVAIVGDFDTSQAVGLVTKYFGRIPKAERAVPREIPTEPAVKTARRVRVEEAWPLPVVVGGLARGVARRRRPPGDQRRVLRQDRQRESNAAEPDLRGEQDSRQRVRGRPGIRPHPGRGGKRDLRRGGRSHALRLRADAHMAPRRTQ